MTRTPLSLRARLFLALLALALAPTLVFAWFTFVQLHKATGRQYQAGVETALQSAIETNRTTLTRLEATTLERADAWAATLPGIAADPRQRDAMRAELRRAGLDFAQVYERDSTAWRLAGSVVPAGVLAAEPPQLGELLADALAGDRLLRSPAGVLGAVAPVTDGVVLVAGVHLNPGYWEQLEQIRRVRDLYARVSVVVDVQRQSVWLTVFGLALLIAVGAALLARVLANGMTQPLSRLSRALERVEGAEPHERLAETGPRELVSLATSFNAMTARLADARAQLARAERESAWRELAQRMAHEIKNPLTPMSLSIHRLQRRLEHVPESDRAAVRDSLAALLQELDHLTRLADSFSQYARMPEPREEALDFSEIARAAGALHEPAGLTLRIACDLPLPVRGDRLLLSRAVHNLLVNAIEASPSGGELELVSGRDGANAWVEVRDRGPGLDPKVAARVFEPYVSSKNRGSGLGLSLVRDIAEQHRGHVELVNRDGGGALARLTLPVV
jgi:nitrogen fixation/metabolism regulation signal transduction histidine kinase